ncbi:MAG: hypothetical protein H7A51_02995 [Akkermansiaceae bacterium]|nr:hypothetical protein [Akkermansiaceae bacterium]
MYSFILNFVISAGVLWFLISYFTRGDEGGERKAITICMIVMTCNLVMSFTLRPLIGGFTLLVSLAVLFFSIEWICDTSRRNTWWITVCYLVIMLLIGLVSALLTAQVDT